MILPAVREQECIGDRARIVLVANATLEYFAGHFPGFPVLPGVVQVGWTREFSDLLFGGRHTVKGMRRIKFMRLITPEIPVTLELNRDQGRINFHYFDSDSSFSSGVLEVEHMS